MRTASKLLIYVAALLALLAVAVTVAVSTVDVNTLIGPVRDRVKALTGRDLAVQGGAHLALSLTPRLVLDDVTLSNAPWGTAKDLLTARHLELEVALLPLLSRRIELVQLALVDPVISLETDAKGQQNWANAAVAGAAPGTAAPGTPAAPGAPAAFAVGNILITNGSVTYRDGASDGVTRIAIEKLLVRARDASAPIVAEFRGRINDVPVMVEGTLGPAEALLQRRWPYAVSLQGELAGQKTAISTKIRADNTRYTLDELKITLGANALTGSFAVVTGGPRPRLVFDLSGPVLALNALPLPVSVPGSASQAAPAPKAAHHYMFPDTPVDFALLRLVDAQGALAVARLTLADGRQFENLRVQFTLDDGRLDVPSLSVAMMGGTASGAITVDASHPGSTALTLRMDGKGLSLEAILAAAGQKREVRGGKTDVNVNLSMQGVSPHAWASSASGTVRAVAGQATLVNTKLDLDSAFDKLNSAINPFRATDPSTELQCAVVRLPLQNGVARVDRSIAMETAKLGVSASGTLDFRNETLDFTFQPKLRKGISLNVTSLADLVRVSGPFASPQIKMDAMGSAKLIATIGAAVSTGGLSAVGQALFAWSEGSGPGPCQIALGTASSAPASEQGSPKSGTKEGAVPLVDDLGRAVGKIFGK